MFLNSKSLFLSIFLNLFLNASNKIVVKLPDNSDELARISEELSIGLSSQSPDKQRAFELLKKVYSLGDDNLTRKLSSNSGEGFYDKTVQVSKDISRRMVCYLPGEYVQPHSHNKHETFELTYGGCHVWTSTNKSSWGYSHYKQGDIMIIPSLVLHCLIAGKDGLCMHVDNDGGRNIVWADKTNHSWEPGAKNPAWKDDLNYDLTVEDLRQATLRQISNK